MWFSCRAANSSGMKKMMDRKVFPKAAKSRNAVFQQRGKWKKEKKKKIDLVSFIPITKKDKDRQIQDKEAID